MQAWLKATSPQEILADFPSLKAKDVQAAIAFAAASAEEDLHVLELDESLPVRLSTFLKELGHDVDTVHDEQRIGHPDSEIRERIRKSRDF